MLATQNFFLGLIHPRNLNFKFSVTLGHSSMSKNKVYYETEIVVFNIKLSYLSNHPRGDEVFRRVKNTLGQNRKRKWGEDFA